MKNNQASIKSTILSPKSPIRLQISRLTLISFIIFLIFLAFVLYRQYLIIQTLEKQLAWIKGKYEAEKIIYASPQAKALPTPTPTPISYPISSNRYAVEISTPKSIAPGPEKEIYKITFDKVTPTSTYSITNDTFPSLIISDSTYKFFLSFPKEGTPTRFNKVPPIKKISTSQFGEVFQITNPFNFADSFYKPEDNQTHYAYTTDYNENCTQFTSIPPACSFLQISYYDQSELKYYLNIVCTVSDQSSSKCDNLISNLEVEKIN